MPSASATGTGPRYTMMVEGMTTRSTPTLPATSAVTNYTSSVHTSIARPTGKTIPTYSCPYVLSSATSTLAQPTGTAASKPVCGLTAPFQRGENHTIEESIVGLDLYSLSDCVIARTSYLLPGNKLRYRCALSCSEDGGPGIGGLEDGWKWPCP